MQVIEHPWSNGGDNSAKPVVKQLDNGHWCILADCDCDADGSPRVGSIDPDSGQSCTSLGKPSWKGPNEYVDSESIPFFVLPLNWAEVTGVKCSLGDMAKLSYKSRVVYAIFADEGPRKLIGEASICAIEAMGGNPWNASKTKVVSGIPFGVSYEVIPGSAKLSRTTSYETIQAYGRELFEVSHVDGIKLPLANGARGSDVETLQKGLNKHINAGLTVDGDFGPKTRAAVIEAARRGGYPKDGVMTAALWEYLLSIKPVADTTARFVGFFKANYAAVRGEVERWFAGVYSDSATHNGCVAHQVSCLKLCKIKAPAYNTLAAINVDAFVDWALENGWTAIVDMGKMKPGDICVSGGSINALDHVYCFVDYVNSETAHVLHNQVWGLAVRSLSGVNCGRWRFALRMP